MCLYSESSEEDEVDVDQRGDSDLGEGSGKHPNPQLEGKVAPLHQHLSTEEEVVEAMRRVDRAMGGRGRAVVEKVGQWWKR